MTNTFRVAKFCLVKESLENSILQVLYMHYTVTNFDFHFLVVICLVNMNFIFGI